MPQLLLRTPNTPDMKKAYPAMLGAFAALSVMITPSYAADSAWAVDAAGTWITPGNWTAGVPGIAAGTDSTDIATFSFTLSAARDVTVDANRNIGGITFGNTSAFGYTLKTGAIRLSSGGVIQNTASTGAHTDTISSAIAIQGASGATASFTSNAPSATAARLLISGGVSGVATENNTTTLTLNGSSAATNPTSGAATVSGAITDGTAGGKVAVVKDGNGDWQFLSTGNTFSGGLTLNSGRLVAHNNSLGSGTVTINGGVLAANSGNFRSWNNAFVIGGDFQLGATGGPGASAMLGTMDLGAATRTISTGGVTTTGQQIQAVISGASGTGLTRALGVGSTEKITLNGLNTYDGTTTINSGTLVAVTEAASSQSMTTNTTTGTNTQVTVADTSGLAVGQVITGTGIPVGTMIASITNGTTFVMTQAATVAATNTGSFLAADGLGAGGAVVMANVASAALVLKGSGAVAIGSLSGGGTTGGDVALGTGTLTMGSDNTDKTYSGVLSGGAGIIKVGSGSQTFDRGNVYTGGTTISAGALLVSNTSGSGTGAGAVVANGGTLGGIGGSISGATTINANATLAPGTTAGTVGLLNFGSTLSLSNADSKVTFDIATGVRGTDYDAVNVAGALTYDGDFTLAVATLLPDDTSYDLFALTGAPAGSFDTVAFSGGAYTAPFTNNGGVWTATQGAQTLSFNQATGDLTVAAVPEPSTGMMLISALGFSLLLRRRSRGV
jgi:autotransporter-associated beta strand protein